MPPDIQPDSKRAVEFLKNFRPSGLINLVAIDPTKKTNNIAGITCPASAPKVSEFLEKYNGKRNLYFMVNTPKSDAPDNKLKKEHVAEINGVWLDADPDKSKLFEDERKRMFKFAKELKDSTNPPTYIVDSGGGIQAFWLLNQPVPVTDDTKHEYEALSRGLAEQYNTDHVQNIDRIMRIPFTVNIPTEDKKKHGRKKALARYKKTGPLYTKDQLRDFIAPVPVTDTSADLSLAELSSLNLISEVNIDVLPDALKNKIIHGVPDGDDRSKAFYSVVYELFKMGFSADAIFSLLAVHPNGIAQKYILRGVSALKVQVENCFKKVLKKETEDLLSISNNENNEKQTKTHPYALEFSTIDELINRPPPEYLIQDILPEHGVCTIVGPSASFKSFIAIALAMHVSQGQDLGTMKVKKGKVLFMINEGQGYFAYRCKAWLNYHDIPSNDDFLIAPKTVNLANDREFNAQLADLVANHTRPALVVIDTLHKASLGTNENTAEDMGLIFGRAQQIADKLSCTVLLIDHTGKDPSKGGRGSYVKFANADMVGAVNRVDKVATLVIKKQKDGEDDLSFSFECDMCFVPELGQLVPVLVYTDKKDLTQGDFITQIVSENLGIKKEEVQEQFEQNYPDKKGNFRSAISRLIKNGRLKEKDGSLHLAIDDDFN